MATMTLFSAGFDSDEDDFVYLDDAFGTNRAAYADGQRIPTGGFTSGALRVELGGVDNLNITNGMSGGWQRGFIVDEDSTGTLIFRYNMSHLVKYDADEFTEVRVAIDGVEQPVVDHLDGGVYQATTGWQSVELDLGALSAGAHTLTIGGFNNKKTKSTEAGEILIDDVVLEATQLAPGETVLFDAGFDADADGFAYIDDAFGTSRPAYADGQRVPTGGFLGGALRVELGGVDNSNVTDGMSGGWQRSFTVDADAEGILTFRYNMSHLVKYDADEFTEVRVAVDGVELPVVAHLDGGTYQATTGWQIVELDLGRLGMGDHTLTIGGFNNKKTKSSEAGEILIDEVSLTTLPAVPVLNLFSLDGTNGFVIAGIDRGDMSGHSVSDAGDVNGDGFADLIIGTVSGDGGPDNSLNNAGESYVVFGRASGFGPVIELSSLDGTNGFLIPGVDERDSSGRSVSGAGDVNGDGVADLIIGADTADGGPGNSRSGAGESYVVFGHTSGFAPVVELSSLDGTNGFLLAGINEGDQSGVSVSSAGDVNGDGFADLIVGAFAADGGPDNSPEQAGEIYVVFGKGTGFASVLELSELDGNNGFLLAGINPHDSAGISVSSGGDVNGDGFADLIIGSTFGAGGPDNAPYAAGESHVVFGKASGFGSVLELSSLDGANGFLLAGIDRSDLAGRSVSSAGDVNGDGLADLIIGAQAADGPDNLRLSAGESYVVFGKASGFGSVVELSSLDGSNGFIIYGIDSLDASGHSVSGAGDVNGDGLDDVIVGAYRANDGPVGDPTRSTGESYLVFGQASGFGSALDLETLSDHQGILIAGIDRFDSLGRSVSGAGDVNGDGFSDLIVAAPFGYGGPGNPTLTAGESYVIFGGDFTGAVDQQGGDTDDTLTGDATANVLIGGRGNDTLIGNGGPDVLYGAQGDDHISVSDASFQRVDGGTGTDTLVFGTSGLTLDLTAIPDSKLRGIEQVDLNFDNNTLVLSPLEVLNLSDNSNRLVVFGESGDTVQASGDWVFRGFDTLDGTNVTKYASGAAELWIDSAVTADLDFTIELDNLTDVGFSARTLLFAGAQSLSSAGDINGDGFEDLLFGSPAGAGIFGPYDLPGYSYVIYGKASGFESLLLLSNLDGTNGFVLPGIDSYDYSGHSVSGAGDINGDGFADLIIGANEANGGPGDPLANAGESYVVFGKASGFGSQFELSSLDGTNGFLLPGIDAGDFSGISVSLSGDINGDGFADLVIGAQWADRLDLYGYGLYAGEAYVVFGRESGFDPVVDLSALDGSNGFLLAGRPGSYDYTGQVVSTVGDFNGDGFDDVVIAGTAYGGGSSTFVVFGKASGFSSVMELGDLDGASGFRLSSPSSGGLEIRVSGAGDLNGDGFADLILGAPDAGENYAGRSIVIFGRGSGFASVVDVNGLDGSDGFIIDGLDDGERLGSAVSGAGDVNGDGFDDILIGVPGGAPLPIVNYDYGFNLGLNYVVFGRQSGFGSAFDLASMGPEDGLRIPGFDEFRSTGTSVSSAGDVNGDGFGDIVVLDQNDTLGGTAHTIFGGDFSGAVDQQGGDTDDTLTGGATANVLIGGRGNDTLIGNGSADVLYGGQGDDVLAISDAALQRLNGGTGTDTLRLDGPGFALDLTLIADLRIEEIEAVDLQEGAGAHSLTLSLLEVLNISDTSNSLTILGDGADTVAIGAGWASQGVGGGFETFTQGAATLEIDADIVVTA